MDDIILKAENISKQYRLGLIGTGTIGDDLNRWWSRLRGKEDPYLKVGDINDRATKGNSEYVWALKDINFQVKRGEVLGIIGKNGAGKSTLLKILSKVTSPTTGEIKTKGRIASLLEVGTGFHPEMTGRENIYLNGAILGMTKKEITSKINEIISFSGCERYIDTPVKRYSSGMTVRLAFAVAAHLEPEILIVDEVLAVGDAEFQKKAIGKMQDISKGEGRTVLFVSHNMAAVKRLCTRAIILENGTSIFEGEAEEATNLYLNTQKINNNLIKILNDESKGLFEKGNVKLVKANIESINNFDISKETYINFTFQLLETMRSFNLSLILYSQDDIPIFNSISPVRKYDPGTYKASLILPENFLNDINYKVRIFLVNKSKAILDVNDILSWDAKEIKERNIDWYGRMQGLIRPNLKWQIEKSKDKDS
ncbi:MAG: ABC transporter ATP-binding protein [Jejuia sp.]